MATRPIAQTHVKDIAVLKEKISRSQHDFLELKERVEILEEFKAEHSARDRGWSIAKSTIAMVASFGAGVVATLLQLKGILN